MDCRSTFFRNVRMGTCPARWAEGLRGPTEDLFSSHRGWIDVGRHRRLLQCCWRWMVTRQNVCLKAASRGLTSRIPHATVTLTPIPIISPGLDFDSFASLSAHLGLLLLGRGALHMIQRTHCLRASPSLAYPPTNGKAGELVSQRICHLRVLACPSCGYPWKRAGPFFFFP